MIKRYCIRILTRQNIHMYLCDLTMLLEKCFLFSIFIDCEIMFNLVFAAMQGGNGGGRPGFGRGAGGFGGAPSS